MEPWVTLTPILFILGLGAWAWALGAEYFGFTRAGCAYWLRREPGEGIWEG